MTALLTVYITHGQNLHLVNIDGKPDNMSIMDYGLYLFVRFLRFFLSFQVVCTEGPERIRELIAMGASFDHGEDGNLHLAREGGHSHHRIVHAADMTGREIERALLEAVLKDPNIFMFQHHFAIDLLTSQVYFLLMACLSKLCVTCSYTN